MPLFSRFSPERIRRSRLNKPLTFGTLAALCMTCSCAKLPPGQSTQLSGRRIHVVMRFSSPMQSSFYYYFLINKYQVQGTTGARGPVPVLSPAVNGGYGNGFATGSTGGGVGNLNGVTDYGITDYVLFHSPQPNGGIGLYHFSGDPNTTPSTYVTTPLSVILPDLTNTIDPTAANTLQFDIDMVSLVTDTNDITAKIVEARQIRYLQVNIVATNITPTDPTTVVNKEVDSMGDTLNPNDQNSFLQIDLTQSRTYSSGGDNVSTLTPEPPNDLYPSGSPDRSLEMVSWTITVQPSS